MQMDSSFQWRKWMGRFGLAMAGTALVGIVAAGNRQPAIAQSSGQALTLRSDIQEANALTGVLTARGNVQIDYPARQIQATAAQAQYYSREQRIVLSGDVYVLQEGNSLQGEVVVYLIDEGRFVAEPDTGEQVQSIYIVPDATVDSTASSVQPEFNPKPELKTPLSP